MDEGFNYAKEFKSLDLNSREEGLRELMTKSQDWWPADFGHYGLCSSVWRGTVPHLSNRRRPWRAGNGSQRFAPLNSWPTIRTSTSADCSGDQAEVRPENSWAT